MTTVENRPFHSKPLNECNRDFTPVDNEDRQWTPHTLGCNIAKSHAAPGFQLGIQARIPSRHDPQELFSGPDSHLFAVCRCPSVVYPRLGGMERESALQLSGWNGWISSNRQSDT